MNCMPAIIICITNFKIHQNHITIRTIDDRIGVIDGKHEAVLQLMKKLVIWHLLDFDNFNPDR